MKKISYPILALILANIIWGATSPIIKFALQNIPPLSLAFIRFLLASSILYPFVHKSLPYTDLKNRWLWLFSLSSVTINIIFFFFALQRTASINAPVIGSAGPIMILVGSAIFLHEKIKKIAIIGTLVSLMGILLIIFQPLLEKGMDREITGNLLLIVATLGAVVGTIAGRRFLTPQNAARMTFWSMLIGTLTFLPFMLLEFGQNPGWIANLDYRGWTGIIFGAVFSSLIAYSVYDWALANLPAYRTSVFTYIDPVIAIVIAIPLLGERLTVPFIIGSVLVFAGIMVAEKRLHYHPLHKILEK